MEVEKVHHGTDLDAVYEVAAAPAHHKGTQPAVQGCGLPGKASRRDYTDHEHRHADKKPALPATRIGQQRKRCARVERMHKVEPLGHLDGFTEFEGG